MYSSFFYSTQTQEVFRALSLRRRDLDIVARVSPGLLPAAVVKSFWVLEVRDRKGWRREKCNTRKYLWYIGVVGCLAVSGGRYGGSF